MENLVTINTMIELAQTAPLVVVFYLMYKAGFFSNSRKEQGNTIYKNGYQVQINSLKDHAAVANEEMGSIKSDMREVNRNLSKIGSDIAFIKGKLEK